MELIGTIVKETTRFKYNRNGQKTTSREESMEIQQAVLRQLLEQAKHTYFGIIHSFHDALNSDNLLESFKRETPLTDYDSFHDQWLSKALDGASDIVWPGRIKYYARSSGTSGASSKRIPVSSTMLKQFKRTAYRQIIHSNAYNLPPSFYQSKFLILGGSTQLSKYGIGQSEGDLSGILAKNKSLALSGFSKPGKKISKIDDWNTKVDQIAEMAPKWNIGVISGVPSWVLLLLDRIIERHNLKTIHDIWPNLSLYIHGGVFVEPYREKLDKMLGKPIHYQNTFLASEGYFAYQKDPFDEAMELLINEGIFYEFVEEQYFDFLRNKDYYEIPTCTLSEVVPHKKYAMIISTCSGLWRYDQGDIIEFTDSSARRIKIVGRLSNSINICGEHLSEVNLVKAIEDTAKILRITIDEFCVYPSKDYNRHNWYIGSNQHINSNQFSTILNERLSIINDDYRCVRKHLLKAPKIKVLPTEKFYEYLLIKNKFGAQHKFPHVMNPDQIRAWEIFLTNTEFFKENVDKIAS